MMKKFQILIIFFAYFIYISNGQKKILTDAQREACVAKSGLNSTSKKELEKLLAEGAKNLCDFLACAAKTTGVMSEDGIIHEDKFKKVHPDKYEVYKDCLEDYVNAQKKGAEECKIIMSLAQCMKKKDEE